MKHGFINMTALVPTIGHEALVTFGAHFMKHYNGLLHVLICGRSFEPIDVNDRYRSFLRLGLPNVKIYSWEDDEAPQQDDGTPGFWNYWNEVSRNVCDRNRLRQDDFDFVFGSEDYCHKYASVLGAEFIPYDMDRVIYPVKGTPVRRDIRGNYDKIMPTFKKHLNLKVTVFGAESTGKTTLTKRLAESYSALFTPEWARPYLEIFGPTVTDHHMQRIVAGQQAIQNMNREMRNPLVFQDTDLYTTLGYFDKYQMEFDDFETQGTLAMIARKSASALYLVTNSNIPFEKDPLRYGGDKRETDDAYWINLLDRYSYRIT